MMSINRYRLKSKAQKGNRHAKRIIQLLERPDRLIGVILIGNNFVNLYAASLATLLAIHYWGEQGIAAATILLTLVILVFSEVTPKTYAAIKPENVAYPTSVILKPLLVALSPLVWIVSHISRLILLGFGVRQTDITHDRLNKDELRTVVNESSALIPTRHKTMLMNILDMDLVTVEDIMIPRGEITGVDLDDDLRDNVNYLKSAPHTRIPVFEGSINEPRGIFHARRLGRLLTKEDITQDDIIQELSEPYFIPESTSLHQQLINFQKKKQRVAFVVDEYGNVQGLVTLEDILEEIVGEFTTDVYDSGDEITESPDGSFIVEGSMHVRELNRAMQWHLPTDGPKTVSGLVVETLELIPENPVCCQINDYRLEVLQVHEHRIRNLRIVKKS